MVSRHRDWSIARIHRRPPILARASLATTLSSRRHFFLFPFTHQTFPLVYRDFLIPSHFYSGKSRSLVKSLLPLGSPSNPPPERGPWQIHFLSRKKTLLRSSHIVLIQACDSARSLHNSCSLYSHIVALEHYRSPSFDSFKLAGLRYTQYSSLLHPLAGPKFRVFCGGDTRPP